MFEDDVTVPAGWYPDPMGLPQLRWWNNHAWTELTTEARAPVVMQQQVAANPGRRVLYADDEEEILPTRRQQREQREREEEYRSLATDEDQARDAIAGTVPLSTGLREIDAPVVADVTDVTDVTEVDDTTAVSEPSTLIEPTLIEPEPAAVEDPAIEFPAAAAFTAADRALLDEGDSGSPETFDDIFRPRSATSAVSSPFAQYEHERTPQPDGVSSRATTLPRLTIYTAPVWIIALLPLLQLVVGLLILLGFGALTSMAFTVAAFVAPYVVVVLLAIADRAMLRRAGHEHTAHWAWALLTAPVYLIARSMALSRTGGLGLAPLLVWAAFGMLEVASVLVVPGMLISILPTVFTVQAEQSVASEAAIIGANLTVDCPVPPPVLIGQQFTCHATSTAGHDLSVTVSLQRANGWINWRVDDWGNTFTTN